MYKESGKAPAALKDRPRLPEHDGIYFQAFQRLNKSRPIGEQVAHIPESQLESLMNQWGVTTLVEREAFARNVSTLDDVWVKHARAQQRQEIERMRKKR